MTFVVPKIVEQKFVSPLFGAVVGSEIRDG
jgi:hypothetical protein